jgi:hypothetical protein
MPAKFSKGQRAFYYYDGDRDQPIHGEVDEVLTRDGVSSLVKRDYDDGYFIDFLADDGHLTTLPESLVHPEQDDDTTARFTVTLTDSGDGDDTLAVTVEANKNGIEIKPEGYGDLGTIDGYGCPVFLEWANGKLMLHVWADINQEDPTHSIDLTGAKESLRKYG